MTIQVQLDSDTEARLTDQARAMGLSVERAAEQLLQEVLAAPSVRGGKMNPQEFHRMLGEMAAGSENLPDLATGAFSRQSFYEDRLAWIIHDLSGEKGKDALKG